MFFRRDYFLVLWLWARRFRFSLGAGEGGATAPNVSEFFFCLFRKNNPLIINFSSDFMPFDSKYSILRANFDKFHCQILLVCYCILCGQSFLGAGNPKGAFTHAVKCRIDNKISYRHSGVICGFWGGGAPPPPMISAGR